MTGPGISFNDNPNGGCSYTLPSSGNYATDNKGITWNPNPNNIMAYANQRCRDFLSWGQSNVMHLTILSEFDIEPRIVGSSRLVCSNANSTFIVDYLSPGTNVTWSTSPSYFFQTQSGSGKTFTTKAAQFQQGWASITAVLSGECGGTLTKQVWVGPPKYYETGNLSLKHISQYGLNPFPCIPSESNQYTYAMGIHDDDYPYIGGWPNQLNWQGSASYWDEVNNNRAVEFVPNQQGPPMYGSGYFFVDACNDCGCNIIASEGYGTCSYYYTVYPNPSGEKFVTIERVTEDLTKKNNRFDIEILNSNLMKVCTEQGISSKGNIDISALDNGLYYIKIIGEKEVQTEKLIIQRD